MAKITIAGDAVVITSSLSLEDIRKVEKYRPEALYLKGGENNKEILYGIATTTDCGNINEYGASFGRESHDADKKAVITMCIGDVAVENVKEYVADLIGRAVTNLTKIEATIPAVLAEIAEEKNQIMSNIAVAS